MSQLLNFLERAFFKPAFLLRKRNFKWRVTFIQISIPGSLQKNLYVVEEKQINIQKCASFKPLKAEVKYIMFCI